MLHYSKSAGYAIHALSCIGAAENASLVRDIAQCTGLQKPYLAKILNQLAHEGLVKAKRGYHGGITLAKPPEKITLFQVVKAVDRDRNGSDCFFGLEECPCQKHCPAHEPWKDLRKQIEGLLRQTTLRHVMAATPEQRRLA